MSIARTSVLTPFATKNEQWSPSDCDVHCTRVISRAIIECEQRLLQIAQQPGSEAAPELPDALKTLKALTRQLDIRKERVLQELERVKDAFSVAKQAARIRYPRNVDRTRETTREIADGYATCLTYSIVIREELIARGYITDARDGDPTGSDFQPDDSDLALDITGLDFPSGKGDSDFF